MPGEDKTPRKVLVRKGVRCKEEVKKDKGEKSSITRQEDVERRQDINLQETELCYFHCS